jgi:hypothetical protein
MFSENTQLLKAILLTNLFCYYPIQETFSKILIHIHKIFFKYLENTNFKYIENRTFEEFFNRGYELNIHENPLNCSNLEQFLWLLRKKDGILTQLSAECSNNKDIWDLG